MIGRYNVSRPGECTKEVFSSSKVVSSFTLSEKRSPVRCLRISSVFFGLLNANSLLVMRLYAYFGGFANWLGRHT